MAATITLGNETFSLNALIIKHEKYLPLMRSQFSETQFRRKAEEALDTYCKRLFNKLYTRVGMMTDQGIVQVVTREQRRQARAVLDNSCDSLLAALGINIVKHCAVNSVVMFKNSGNSYRMKSDSIRALAAAIKKNVKYNTKSLPIKIGVELEFIADSNNRAAFNKAMKQLTGERYSCTLRYMHNDGDLWILGKDASVRNLKRVEGHNYEGYELSSPVLDLSSASDLEELQKVCELIKNVFGGFTNKTCGTHIHMSFKAKETVSKELVKYFARSYGNNEDELFDKLVPKSRRGNSNKYGRSMKGYTGNSRYVKLNLQHVRTEFGNTMHIEFRQLDGTIDFDKIKAWTLLQKLFVELTLEAWESVKEDESEKVVSLNVLDVVSSSKLHESSVEQLLKMSAIAV